MLKEYGSLQETITAEEKRLVDQISQKLCGAFLDQIEDKIEDDISAINDAAEQAAVGAEQLKVQIDECKGAAQFVKYVSDQIKNLDADIEVAETAVKGLPGQLAATVKEMSDKLLSASGECIRAVRTMSDGVSGSVEVLGKQVETDIGKLLEANAGLTERLQTLTKQAGESDTVTTALVERMQDLCRQSAQICEEFVSLKQENHHAMENCTKAIGSFETICKETSQKGDTFCKAVDSGVDTINRSVDEVKTALQDVVDTETKLMESTFSSIAERLSQAVDSYIAQLQITNEDFSEAYHTLCSRNEVLEREVKKIEETLIKEAERSLVRERENRRKFWVSAIIGGSVLVLQLLQMIL